MNKLFGLLLLALTFFAPIPANAAAKFLVLCTTACTWDNTNDAIWSTSSGGANNTTHPVAGDDVTLDASSCVGGLTCTITTGAVTISIQSLVMSACTASTAGCILDASANNTNFTISGSAGYVNTGAGTRTLNMGNGTWAFSIATQSTWNVVASATINAGSSTIATTGGGTIIFTGGGKTYSTLSIGAVSASSTNTQISGVNTFATLTIAAPNRIQFSNGQTQTVTTMTNVNGNSSQQVLITGNIAFGAGTISSANNWTCNYCGIAAMTFAGGGTFTGTNSFSFGGNTGITITAPSGGGGGRIIGG